MGLPRHRVSFFCRNRRRPSGLVLEPELAWAWGRGSIVSSLIGEPIRPVDQEGWLPLTIRKWGFLLPVKPGLSTRPARKPLFEQRDYCSGPLRVNSSWLESFLRPRCRWLPPAQSGPRAGRWSHHRWSPGSAETLQRMLLGRSSRPAFTPVPPVTDDTALHHPLVAVDKFQFGQPQQVPWAAHPRGGAPGGHFAVLPEEGGQPQLLVVFRRGRQASRLWFE